MQEDSDPRVEMVVLRPPLRQLRHRVDFVEAAAMGMAMTLALDLGQNRDVKGEAGLTVGEWVLAVVLLTAAPVEPVLVQLMFRVMVHPLVMDLVPDQLLDLDQTVLEALVSWVVVRDDETYGSDRGDRR